MRDIFRAATIVRIWLGVEKRYTRLCFQVILDETPFSSKALILEDESFLEGIADLLISPWWRRFWVVQEVILAAQVTAHCGDLAVDVWQLLQNFVAHIHFLSGNRSIGHALEGASLADDQFYQTRTSSRFNIITPLHRS